MSQFLSNICADSNDVVETSGCETGGGGGGGKLLAVPTSNSLPPKVGGRGGDMMPAPLPTGDMSGDSGAVVVKLEGPGSWKESFLSVGDLNPSPTGGCCPSATDFFLERFCLAAPGVGV